MRAIDSLLSQYGESHQNATNKLIHWICVPGNHVQFVRTDLRDSIPGGKNTVCKLGRSRPGSGAHLLHPPFNSNVLRLCVDLCLILWGNNAIFEAVDRNGGQLAIVSLIIFAVAWVGQFIGHKIEGKKPSFFKDVQFLLVGPAWLLHFIYKKVGVKY